MLNLKKESIRSWKKHVLYFLILIIYLGFKRVEATTSEVNDQLNSEHENYQVFRFHFEPVSDAYSITLWILLGTLFKIGKYLRKDNLLEVIEMFFFCLLCERLSFVQ